MNRKLWIHTVSKEVADSVSEREQKRQEVLSELMYTERDFVKDLEYLRDFWMKPLRSANHISYSGTPPGKVRPHCLLQLSRSLYGQFQNG